MKGKIVFFVFISFFIASTLLATNTIPFSLKWFFYLNNGWSWVAGVSPIWGYPGRVDYGTGWWEIYPGGILSGSFWMWNVWWVTFSHGVFGSGAQINCPTDIWNDSTQPCPVSGSAWSENAGWIVFWSNEIGTGSGAYFDPNTGNLAWYWWNKSLGWVPLWSWLTGSVVPDATSIADPLDGVPINFVSHIAIVGNIAWSRVFSVENNSIVNQDVWYSYKTVDHPKILNMLRRNIALMSRNISDADLADINSPYEFIIIKNNPSNPDFRINFNNFLPYVIAWKRSIVVIWWDIVIDEVDVNTTNWSDKNVALIALKDDAWNGGNIVIYDRVKRIYAYMYAEWTVYSWEKVDSTSPIVPYSDSWIWHIPKWQLYIRWLVASKNTIGWSQQKPTPVCPVLVSTCTTASSYAYDWDYFRTYNTGSVSQWALPVERSTVPKLQSATMIIEYDSQILVDPPPWFREQ